jgi:regulatory protein
MNLWVLIMPKVISIHQAISDKAMVYLARREHARTELYRKVIRHFEDDVTTVNEVLDHLAQRNLQSDTRYAEMYIRARMHAGFGPARIRMEMVQKGVAPEVAELALDDAEVDWAAQAHAALIKKFGLSEAEDFAAAMKRKKFMFQRGFQEM